MKKMKLSYCWCLLFVGAMLICSPVQAELLIYEGFGYRESPLGLQDGGYGWLDGWCEVYDAYKRSGESQIMIEPDQTLTKDMDNYTFNGVRGRANIRRVDPMGANMAERMFGTMIPVRAAGTYYMSYLMNSNIRVYFQLQFYRMASKAWSASQMFRINWSQLGIGLEVQGGEGLVYSPEGSVPDQETRFIVIKLVSDGNGNLDAYGKIYAPSDEFDITDENLAWDVSTSGTITANAPGIDAIKIVAGTNANAWIDELRIGTEWKDVVPGVEGFVTTKSMPGKPIADPDLLAYDGFAYSGFHLGDTSDSGHGWIGPWYGSYLGGNNDPEYDPNNPGVTQLATPSKIFLTHQNVLDMDNLYFEPVGGAAMDYRHQVQDETGESLSISGPAYRYLAEDSLIDFDTNDDYYVSFLLRQSNMSSGCSRYAAFKLSYMAPYGQSDRVTIGVSACDNAWQVGILDDTENSVMMTSGQPYVVEDNKTYFVVAKISTKDATEGNSDQVFLKVYEATDTIDLAETTTWTLSTPPIFNNARTADTAIFYFGSYSTFMFDELRIGKTWESVVTPVQPCQYPEADANGDCRVDMADFSMLADQWLID